MKLWFKYKNKSNIQNKILRKIEKIYDYEDEIIKIYCIVLIISIVIFLKKSSINSYIFNNITDNQIVIETFNKCINFWMIILFVIFIFYNLIKKTVFFILDKKQNELFNREVKDNLERNNNYLLLNLYNYFSRDEDKTPILITGEWGSGKTKTVNDFFEKYYKYKSVKAYRISCFGITTRENLVERIKGICEKEDKSLYKSLISSLELIPIIGNFLKEILLSKYDFNDLKKNSIFIFDNFERIECCVTDIDERTNKIENVVSILEKYNIVTGVIDEIIEQYGMKVVIIANTKEMLPVYVYETFICKLGCKKFYINPRDLKIKEIWNECLNKIDIIEKSKILLVKKEKEIIELATEIWMMSSCYNIRIIQRLLYGYISLIDFLIKNNYEIDESCNELLGILATLLIIGIDVDGKWLGYKGVFFDIHPNDHIAMYLNKFTYLKPNLGKNEKIFFNKVNYEWYCNNKDSNEVDSWKNIEGNYYRVFDNLNFHKSYKEYRFWKNITFYNAEDVLMDKNAFFLWDDIMYIYKVKTELRERILQIIKENRVVCIYSDKTFPWTKEQKEFWYDPDNILAVLSKYDLIDIIKADDTINIYIYRMLKKRNEEFGNYIVSVDAINAYKELYRGVNMQELENRYRKYEFEENWF